MMLTSKTASSNEMLTYLATDTVKGSGDKSQNTVWSHNFSTTIGPLVFYSPDIEDVAQRSDNDPVWDYVDKILEEIWAENQFASVEDDDLWLDEMRIHWNNNIEDMYDEPDTGK